jgi:hypothetical protein
MPPPPENTFPAMVDVAEKLATIAAIIAGAIWTYFNFFKGRTYRLRLEPKITGQLFSKGGTTYLISSIQLKNVGLSRIGIQQRGSGLRLYAFSGAQQVTEVKDADWRELGTVSIFKDHQWIEPGETIEDQRLFTIPPGDYQAFQLLMRMPSKGIVWMARAIVRWNPPDADANRSDTIPII